MPYDVRFLHAKNLFGKQLRDEATGNPIERCRHSPIIYPEFGTELDYHAGFIPLERKTFKGFRGTCQRCGEALYIDAENVVRDYEAQNKVLEKSLKEMDDKIGVANES